MAEISVQNAGDQIKQYSARATCLPHRVYGQLTLNQRVPGSSPGAPTNKIKDLARKPRSCAFPSNVGATCRATRIIADQSFLARWQSRFYQDRRPMATDTSGLAS